MRLAASAVLAAVALVAAGCGSAEDEAGRPPAAPPPATTTNARDLPLVVTFDAAEQAPDGTAVEIAAGLYEDDAPMRICREIAESYPPQCGRSIPVVGVSWDDVPDVERASGVTWTNRPVGLVGEMRGGVLHVRELREPRPLPPGPAEEPPPVKDGDEPVSSKP